MRSCTKSLITGILILAAFSASAGDYLLYSPNKQIEVKIQSNAQLTWLANYHGQALLAPSVISLAFTNGIQCGVNGKVIKEQRRSVDEVIDAVVPVKSKKIADRYNEIKLLFDKKYVVVFRAYDNGIAYRFETSFGEGEVEVAKEEANFSFTGNNKVLWSDEKDTGFQSHFESLYTDSTLAAYNSNQHAALPFYTQAASGVSMIISEADLYDYPNLFLFGTGGNSLTAGFPKVIQQQRRVADRRYQITQLASYIAKTKATRTYPWRLVTITDNDKGLLESNLTYQLASPNVLKDVSWIKPGKVAWDWWNANNIYGVPFKAGINTATYKYYVDFASAYHLEYVILDEGWSRTTVDVLHPNAQLDIHELIQYATAKNVGIILWTLWNPLDSALNETLDTFAAWGVKGLKVDFMARADQYMVNYYERVAKAAAERKLLVDLHGAYKPVGLNRKYPNVLSYEGVRGLENDKWGDEITPKHDVTLPFTRMVAGPMDFTPGAMINGNKRNFHISFTEPMSQGTRAHQVAMYMVYESPLQMLADNPSNYLRDPACTRFIAQVPVTWDTTIALHGKAGEYVAVARKHGDKWYIGAMTNWTARSLTLPLTFLEKGDWQMEVLKDGVNVQEHAADYTIEATTVTSGDTVTAGLSSGGGWSAVFTKKTL